MEYSHDRGDVTRFLVQLEYRLDDTWTEVVRYDHDPKSEFGHNVTEEGLHIDIYNAENYFHDLGGDTGEAVPDGGDQ
ncbi:MULTISPECIES: hypothetical protein [Halobacterium]|nr:MULTISPECIES: hypothetical protein [Halobacterium]MDL0124189.1 hypothetical protein [Halobacterium salinarum]QRY24834.1 hypothetical protein JRZ79_00045 [Halobacterium sp. BOL4-2]